MLINPIVIVDELDLPQIIVSIIITEKTIINALDNISLEDLITTLKLSTTLQVLRSFIKSIQNTNS